MRSYIYDFSVMHQNLTDEQIQELFNRANEGIEPVKAALRRLSIPSSSVFARAKQLGLSSPKRPPKLSNQQAIMAYQLVVEERKQIKDVAFALGVDAHTLGSAWKRAGLESPGRQSISDAEVKRIYAAYAAGELQLGQAAKALGIARITLSSHARKLGLIQPKIVHTCNHHFFSERNPKTAYWVGWLASDGNLQACLDNGRKIKLKLHERDVSVLEALRQDLEATQSIAIEQATSMMRKLEISSPAMFDDLVDWGLHPRKSLTLQPPEFLSGSLAWAWIAGYHAGDGWTSRYKHKVSVGFVGTLEVLTWVRQAINTMLDIPAAGNLREKDVKLSKNTWTLCYSGNGRPLAILRWMYNHSPYALERKYRPLLEHDPSLSSKHLLE